MKILKNYAYRWWQVGLLKLSLLSIGIAIGAHFREIFFEYRLALAVIGIMLAIYIILVSVRQ